MQKALPVFTATTFLVCEEGQSLLVMDSRKPKRRGPALTGLESKNGGALFKLFSALSSSLRAPSFLSFVFGND